LLRPTIPDDANDVTDIDFATFAAFLSASARIGGRFRVRVEVPFARIGGFDSGAGTLDGSTIGNPYLGVVVGRADHGVTAEVGARLPLTSNRQLNAAWVGGYSDIARFEAFLIDWTTVTARARYRFHDPGGFTFETGGGPSLRGRKRAPGESRARGEIMMNYHLAAGFENATLQLRAGFAGWIWMTRGEGGVGERTFDQLEGTVALTSGRLQPALHLILPMDNGYSASVRAVVGVGVRYVMR
jgi:hypothetical protein